MLTNPPSKPHPKHAHETMNRSPRIRVNPKRATTSPNAQAVMRTRRLVMVSNCSQRVIIRTHGEPLLQCRAIPLHPGAEAARFPRNIPTNSRWRGEMSFGAVRVPTAQLCHSGPDLGNPELVTQTEVRAKNGSIERAPFPGIARAQRPNSRRPISEFRGPTIGCIRQAGRKRAPTRPQPAEVADDLRSVRNRPYRITRAD